MGMDVRQGRRDIESRADCERLVRAFYGRALEDPIIGFIFVDVAKLDRKVLADIAVRDPETFRRFAEQAREAAA